MELAGEKDKKFLGTLPHHINQPLARCFFLSHSYLNKLKISLVQSNSGYTMEETFAFGTGKCRAPSCCCLPQLRGHGEHRLASQVEKNHSTDDKSGPLSQ